MHGKATLRKRDASLEFVESVLAAAMEGSPDGILIVNEQGQIISYNHKFFEMWRLPSGFADAPTFNALLDAASQELKDPDAFAARVKHLYDHPEEPSHDLIEFKDDASSSATAGAWTRPIRAISVASHSTGISPNANEPRRHFALPMPY